jgi:hypothetical protein
MLYQNTLHITMPDLSTYEDLDARIMPETSVFEIPSYAISRAPDRTLQWDPPADSEDLAIALSYHFPAEKSLKEKMQKAMEKFLQEGKRKRQDSEEHVGPVPRQGATISITSGIALRTEGGKTSGIGVVNQHILQDQGDIAMREHSQSVSNASQPRNQPKSKSTAPNPLAIPGLMNFNAKTLQEVKPKRKKRAYDKEERVNVAANRGNACAEHRRRKLKVCIFCWIWHACTN